MENKELIELLHGPYYLVNKKMIQIFGINTSVFLSDIISKWSYFKERNMITEDEYFYNTRENIERDTTLSPSTQYLITEQLKKKGLLEVKKIGLPAKNYYRINFIKIAKILQSYSAVNLTAQDRLKLDINNNKVNNNKDSLSKDKESKFDNLPDNSFKLIDRKKLKTALKETFMPEINNKVKKAIEYWNSKGKPLPKHIIQDSKIIIEINKKLKKKINRENLSLLKIMKAIDLYYDLLISPNVIPLNPLSMSQFLLFDSKYIENRNKKIEVDSWFDECMRGRNYVFKKYGKFVKNNYPEIVEKMKAMWKEKGYKASNDIAYTENNFRRASKKLMDFIEANRNRFKVNRMDQRPLMFVNHLFNALAKGDKDKIRHGSISSDYMFNEILPAYLKERGII